MTSCDRIHIIYIKLPVAYILIFPRQIPITAKSCVKLLILNLRRSDECWRFRLNKRYDVPGALLILTCDLHLLARGTGHKCDTLWPVVVNLHDSLLGWSSGHYRGFSQHEYVNTKYNVWSLILVRKRFKTFDHVCHTDRTLTCEQFTLSPQLSSRLGTIVRLWVCIWINRWRLGCSNVACRFVLMSVNIKWYPFCFWWTSTSFNLFV